MIFGKFKRDFWEVQERFLGSLGPIFLKFRTDFSEV